MGDKGYMSSSDLVLNPFRRVGVRREGRTRRGEEGKREGRGQKPMFGDAS